MIIKELNQLIADGYIKVNKHPTADLFIYNYTSKTQYEHVWNYWTLTCRGLIMDKDYNIVARPFQKFFNLSEFENQVIPNENFEVYEKMDGSLGILYWLDNKPFIATRGSFISEQAQEATQMLNTQYAHVIPLLDKSKTYLFEIIYPENRIVLDYGNKRKLVLLAIIDTQTGTESPVETFHGTSLSKAETPLSKEGTSLSRAETPLPKEGTSLPTHFFPIVKRYDGLNDLLKLKQLEEENKEGFVVKFKDGFRLKVKFDEYQRLHRIVTQMSNQDVWEYLKDDKDFAPLLERVPDEFYDWVKDTKAQLLEKYSEIEASAKEDFKVLENRKETALYFMQCQYPTVMFKMLDGQNYEQTIWKIIKPDYQKPFSSPDPQKGNYQ
jgi:RNA ligase